MSGDSFKDLFSKQADYYKKGRPNYPEELFQYLSSLCKQHDCAWDCATGNGQAAASLTPFFKKVIATDASESQLKNATHHPAIEYRKATAENSGIPSHSVDLITVATAIHWFNLEKFYTEVKRVIKPGGVFACWAYYWSDFSPDVNKVMHKLAGEILNGYWADGRELVNNKYRTLYFPFEQLTTPSFYAITHWNLNQFKTNLRSWSSSQQYYDKHGINPVDLVAEELEKAWGDKETIREGKWEIFLKVARI
jgi:SAM-dependent methyltransferase